MFPFLQTVCSAQVINTYTYPTHAIPFLFSNIPSETVTVCIIYELECPKDTTRLLRFKQITGITPK